MKPSCVVVIVLLALLVAPTPRVFGQTVTTISTFTTTSTTIITCPNAQPLGEHIGFGNSSVYETFEVESWIVICGHYFQYGQVHVAVTTAWINNLDYQKAANLSFTFEGAYYWLNSTKGCDIAALAPPPAIRLHLIQEAYFNSTSKRYYPPAYGGQGDLCFQYPESYRPVFNVRFANGTSVQLRQAPSQTPSYHLDIASGPVPPITVTSTATTTVIVPQPLSAIQNPPSLWDVVKDNVTYILGIPVSIVILVTFYWQYKDRRKMSSQ